jgi:hypothetical protein
MPDRERSYPHSPSNDDSAFPVFPADFEPDTLYLHQALAEHNYDRLATGLSAKNYFQLSAEERHGVLQRACEVKAEARPRITEVIPISSPKQRIERMNNEQVNEEAKEFAGSLGFYLLILGVMGFAALLWRIL